MTAVQRCLQPNHAAKAAALLQQATLQYLTSQSICQASNRHHGRRKV
jgi:hypothetical protein